MAETWNLLNFKAEVFDESTLLTRLMPLVIMCRMQRFASEVQMNGADQESLQRCASSLTSEKSAGSLTADELESIGCANENDDERFFFQVLDLSHSILAIFIFNKQYENEPLHLLAELK